DPGAPVTYVNYPTTEYLDLPFLDLVCFNVFLEDEGAFGRYLARLQNVAGDRPLLLTEIGLDSRGNGEDAQARSIEWQLRSAFGSTTPTSRSSSWTTDRPTTRVPSPTASASASSAPRTGACRPRATPGSRRPPARSSRTSTTTPTPTRTGSSTSRLRSCRATT